MMVTEKKNVNWFRKEVEPLLINSVAQYRHFLNGDFGALDRVEINSDKIAIEVDFWELDWLGIYIWDCNLQVEVLNVLSSPSEEADKQENISKLIQTIIDRKL